MAESLATIRTRIQQYGYGTDIATSQTEMINAVYRRIIGFRRWPFLEVDAGTFPTVVGTSSYALATVLPTALHLDAVRLTIGTENYDLRWLDRQDFRSYEHLYRDNATPSYWSKISQEIHLAPRPDRIYTVVVDYVTDPADLVADGDLSVIPAAYQDLVVWGAIASLTFRERDWEAHQWAKAMYVELLGEMMREYGVEQRQTARQVKSSGYLDQVNAGLDGRSGWPPG